MQKQFVTAVCDVYCKWTGEHPRYRAYVEDELFTERTWIWRDMYLEESFQIYALPGKYSLRYELVDPENAKIKMRNLRILNGPAVITPQGDIEIYTPGPTQ
jgi:hypothetical protein